MDYNIIIKEQLKKLRTIKDIKQSDIAIIIEKSRECYNQYENGKRKIDINSLCKIADEYNLPLDWFTGRNIETEKKMKE